jgi:hypothetical protein
VMHWCVIGDDNILMGAGETHRLALEDAQKWLEEAVGYQLDEEIRFAKAGEHKSLDLDMHWRIRPCSEKVAATLEEKGGHSDWTLVDGVVRLNEEVASQKEPIEERGV